MLMNRATPQAVIVSPSQWNAIVDRLEELQDALVTLQAELALATGQTKVERVDDAEAFMREIMETHDAIPA